MFQGMAFGAGSEVAHNVIGGLMGRGNTHQAAPVQDQNVQSNTVVDCLKINNQNIGGCQSQLDSLNSCFQNHN